MAGTQFDLDTDRYLVRRSFEERLESIFLREMDMPPVTYMYGHTSTGKTSAVRGLLKRAKVLQNLAVCFVDCYEALTEVCLFEIIVDRLFGQEKRLSIQVPQKLSNVCVFANFLEQHCVESKSYLLIFDHAEVLRNFSTSLLPVLLHLRELTKRKISCLFVASLVWDRFAQLTSAPDPIIIHVPDFTRNDVAEILLMYRSSHTDARMYKEYVELILDTFYTVCRDIRQIIYQSQLHFKQYSKPVRDGSISASDQRALCVAMRPIMEEALKCIYLPHHFDTSSEDGAIMPKMNQSDFSSLELPYLTKYLLIAAYLASYNPPKSDRKFFMKNAGKMQRSKATAPADRHEASYHVVGPRMFPLERLLAIFYAISEETGEPKAVLYSQISTLVSLRLLAQISSNPKLPKYRCAVSLGFMCQVQFVCSEFDFADIAKSVQFNLMSHLYDFTKI